MKLVMTFDFDTCTATLAGPGLEPPVVLHYSRQEWDAWWREMLCALHNRVQPGEC
jgi:hypothetical protein